MILNNDSCLFLFSTSSLSGRKRRVSLLLQCRRPRAPDLRCPDTRESRKWTRWIPSSFFQPPVHISLVFIRFSGFLPIVVLLLLSWRFPSSCQDNPLLSTDWRAGSRSVAVSGPVPLLRSPDVCAASRRRGSVCGKRVRPTDDAAQHGPAHIGPHSTATGLRV